MAQGQAEVGYSLLLPSLLQGLALSPSKAGMTHLLAAPQSFSAVVPPAKYVLPRLQCQSKRCVSSRPGPVATSFLHKTGRGGVIWGCGSGGSASPSLLLSASLLGIPGLLGKLSTLGQLWAVARAVSPACYLSCFLLDPFDLWTGIVTSQKASAGGGWVTAGSAIPTTYTHLLLRAHPHPCARPWLGPTQIHQQLFILGVQRE